MGKGPKLPSGHGTDKAPGTAGQIPKYYNHGACILDLKATGEGGTD